ncbi:transporter [Ganoderma sinense ZZ0214-1]|uniref:Transporter n=1 Tax=Ganoderma sinense ZZ0214-1 TaxID=1077348 RepID=A0A2G8SVF0_9APHY|nr:transporter [Ganoderma sinense ZZ0214-1]
MLESIQGSNDDADNNSSSISTLPTDSDLGSSDNSEDREGMMAGNGQDNILNSQYARARGELLELMRDLRALGHDKDLDIPQIAVIGKQSAGKSSLVEAVAGINVPRDAGTCTRCPMECTLLTSSDKWSCKISLHGDYINEAFSPEITAKADVELWIRRAQAAVLCPHINKERFTSMSREEIKQATDHTADLKVQRFSNTVVEVKILDPDGTDLVFVDLPGLIPNADDEIVKQVEDMVKDYISQPSTIILVTVPAEDDLENQKAMKLAKDADPQGDRTIGVVTKADKIQPGETGRQKAWRDIFEGRAREHKLRLGYYAVRLPTDEDRARRITPAQARELAARVFNTVAPWKDVKALPRPTRLGVEALIRDLSPLLLKMLIDAIPRLKAAVDDLLAASLAALAQLPARPAMDSAAELVQLVFRFCAAVKETIDGAGDDKAFVHRSLAFYRMLKASIRASAPDFRPFEDPEKYVCPPEPLSQQREDEFSGSGSGSVLGGASVDGDASESELAEDGLDEPVPVMGLLDVRRVIKESTGWELPHNIPYLAKTRLIREFVRRWTEPSKTCFAGIRGLVENYVYEELVPEHFAQFPPLKRFVVMQLRENMEEHRARSQAAVEQVLKREELPYFTQNGHYLETTREVWLGHYREVRALRDPKYRLGAHTAYGQAVHPSMGTSRAISEAIAALRAIPAYSNVSATDLAKLLPTDEFGDELVVMADVRSYFQVAYKASPSFPLSRLPALIASRVQRVIDNVPQTIHHDFVQGFAYGLQAHLLGKLDLGAKDASARIEKLLEEDPDVARERKELEEKKRKLEEMKIRLNNFRI